MEMEKTITFLFMHLECLEKIIIPITKKCKLGPKTVNCAFQEYAHRSIAQRILVVKSEIPNMLVNTIMEFRYAIFFDNLFPIKDIHNISSQTSKIILDPITPLKYSEQIHELVPEEDDSEALRRSKRQMTIKSFDYDFIVYFVDNTTKSISKVYASIDTYYQKEVVHSEMDSIIANMTFGITYRPYDGKPVGCKQVFKKKLRYDDTVEKYKARSCG